MFGYRKERDPRSERFPFRLALDVPPPMEPAKWPVWAMFNKPLNQGNTGTCVGHGAKHFMLVAPIIQTTPTKEPTAFTLYREACKDDAWPENDAGDLQFGTSVLAAFKAMQRLGLVGTYVHTSSIDEIRLWLKTKGPVIIGVDWYGSMMQTGAEGFCRVVLSSGIVGGHCVCLKHWSKRYDAPVFVNSWGRSFGPINPVDDLPSGYGMFDPAELDRLIRVQDGEAVAAVEKRLNPAIA